MPNQGPRPLSQGFGPDIADAGRCDDLSGQRMKENSHWVDFRLFHLGIERAHFNNHANHLDFCFFNSWSGHPTKKYKEWITGLMPETTAFTCFSTTFPIQMQHAEPWFHGNGMLGTCRNLLELGPAKVPSPQRELSEVLWDISVVHVSSEAPTIQWDLCKGCSHFSWLWLIVRFPPWTLGRSSLHYTYVYIYILTCLAAAALVRMNSQHDSTKSSFYILVTWSVYVCSVFIIFALLWRTLVGAWLGPSSSLPLRIRSIVLRSLLALLVLAGRVEKEADGSVQSRLRWVSFEEKKAETQRHLNITECLYIFCKL